MKLKVNAWTLVKFEQINKLALFYHIKIIKVAESKITKICFIFDGQDLSIYAMFFQYDVNLMMREKYWSLNSMMLR